LYGFCDWHKIRRILNEHSPLLRTDRNKVQLYYIHTHHIMPEIQQYLKIYEGIIPTLQVF
jgi:hypothetical protein